MKDFNYYLNELGEIGFVEQVFHSIVYVSGLPGAHSQEVVIFESGDIGQVFSLEKDQLEVLLFSSSQIKVGDKVVRTNAPLSVPVGEGILGRVVNPLGGSIDAKGVIKAVKFERIDKDPPKIMARRQVEKPLETGSTLVDLVVPLSRGQRELVIGDRKTGKTEFLLQTLISQASKGTVCIYAVIGQKKSDILKLSQFLQEKGLKKNAIIVASSSSDTSGLIYLTPYTAMTIAEYFKDKGIDVLLILDDMTTHARTYREVSLLARRFPGRSSYPGDIFYLHARLIERAGNFDKGSITCLPVSETILGDLSGYIQTNLMAMTDGHVFFDIEFYNQGKRPAVNPFLSVTRVGHQTQTPLLRDVSQELSSFLVTYDKMKQFLHFGAEVGETAKKILSLGEKLDVFFNQSGITIIPININVMILAGLWSGLWNETKTEDLKRSLEQVILSYSTDDVYKKQIDEKISVTKSFSELVNFLRRESDILKSKLTV